MNLQAFSRAIDHSCRTNTLQNRFSRTQSLIEHFSMITSEKKKKKKSNIFAFPYHTIYFLGNEGPIWIKCWVLLPHWSCRQICVSEDFVIVSLMSYTLLCQETRPNHYPWFYYSLCTAALFSFVWEMVWN